MVIAGLTEMIAEAYPRLSSGTLVRNRFFLPVEGRIYLVITLLLLVASVLGHSNPLMLIFSLLVANFVVNGQMTFSMLRRLTLERAMPPRVMAGEVFSVNLTLINRRWLLSGWLLNVRDCVTAAQSTLEPEVMFIHSPASSQVQGHYRLRLETTGRYEFGPVYISTRFPWGLVERGIVLANPGHLLVYPRIGRMSTGWKRRLAQATELANQSVLQAGPFDDDFYRIREYRMGDDPRAIHWRTTARRGELMVREFRENRDRGLIVLFDGWIPDKPTEQQRQQVAAGLSFVASVCLDHLRSNRESQIGCLVLGKSLLNWSGGSGEGRLEDLLDGLALFEPHTHNPLTSLWSALEQLVVTHPRTILITPRAEQIRSEVPPLSDFQIVPTDLELLSRLVHYPPM